MSIRCESKDNSEEVCGKGESSLVNGFTERILGGNGTILQYVVLEETPLPLCVERMVWEIRESFRAW